MEEESTRQSRLFVILAIALIGLLVLGLLGIGGVFVIRQNLEEQAALSRPTPTLMIMLPEPSPTFTPVKAAATSTPAPTPTNTPDPSSVSLLALLAPFHPHTTLTKTAPFLTNTRWNRKIHQANRVNL